MVAAHAIEMDFPMRLKPRLPMSCYGEEEEENDSADVSSSHDSNVAVVRKAAQDGVGQVNATLAAIDAIASSTASMQLETHDVVKQEGIDSGDEASDQYSQETIANSSLSRQVPVKRGLTRRHSADVLTRNSSLSRATRQRRRPTGFHTSAPQQRLPALHSLDEESTTNRFEADPGRDSKPVAKRRQVSTKFKG